MENIFNITENEFIELKGLIESIDFSTLKFFICSPILSGKTTLLKNRTRFNGWNKLNYCDTD